MACTGHKATNVYSHINNHNAGIHTYVLKQRQIVEEPLTGC